MRSEDEAAASLLRKADKRRTSPRRRLLIGEVSQTSAHCRLQLRLLRRGVADCGEVGGDSGPVAESTERRVGRGCLESLRLEELAKWVDPLVQSARFVRDLARCRYRLTARIA